MKIHELQLSASKDRKRVGRGIGSGTGKTAGRGTKGQNARTGGGVRVGFAGGQNPLSKLLPKKRGFRALNPTHYQVVEVSLLNGFKDGDTVNAQHMASFGMVKKHDALIKLLAGGKVERKLTVQVNAASKAAIAAIEQAGGSVVITPLPKSPKKATRPKADEAPSAE